MTSQTPTPQEVRDQIEEQLARNLEGHTRNVESIVSRGHIHGTIEGVTEDLRRRNTISQLVSDRRTNTEQRQALDELEQTVDLEIASLEGNQLLDLINASHDADDIIVHWVLNDWCKKPSIAKRLEAGLHHVVGIADKDQTALIARLNGLIESIDIKGKDKVIDKLRSEKRAIEQQQQTTSQEVSNLRSEVSFLESKITRLTQQLSMRPEGLDTNDALREQHIAAMLGTSNSLIEKDIPMKWSNIKQLFERLHDTIDDEVVQKVTELEAAIDEATWEQRELTRTIIEITKLLHDTNIAFSAKKQELVDQQKSSEEELIKQKGELNGKMNTWEVKSLNDEASLKTLQDQNDTQREQMKAVLNESERVKTHLDQKNIELAAQIKKYNDFVQFNTEEAARDNDKVREWTDRFNAEVKAHQASMTTNHQLGAQISGLQIEVKNAKARRDDWEKQFLQKQVDLEDAGKSVAEASAKVAELEAKNEEAHQQLVQSLSSLDRLREENEKELDALRTEKQNEMQAFQSRLAAFRTESKTLQDKIDQNARSHEDALVSEIQKNMFLVEQEKATSDQLVDMTMNRDKLDAALATAKHELESIQSDLGRKQHQIDILQSQQTGVEIQQAEKEKLLEDFETEMQLRTACEDDSRAWRQVILRYGHGIDDLELDFRAVANYLALPWNIPQSRINEKRQQWLDEIVGLTAANICIIDIWITSVKQPASVSHDMIYSLISSNITSTQLPILEHTIGNMLMGNEDFNWDQAMFVLRSIEFLLMIIPPDEHRVRIQDFINALKDRIPQRPLVKAFFGYIVEFGTGISRSDHLRDVPGEILEFGDQQLIVDGDELFTITDGEIKVFTRGAVHVTLVNVNFEITIKGLPGTKVMAINNQNVRLIHKYFGSEN